MRIRLRERCQFLGRIYEPGEEVILPKGMKGPHRAIAKGVDKIDYGTNPPVDANRLLGPIEDVPLFDVIDDVPVRDEEQKKQADAAAQERAHVVERKPPEPIGEKPAPIELTAPVRTQTPIEEREGW